MEQVELGRQLANRRLELGLQQAEIVRVSGMTQSQVSRVENGADARLSTILNLCRALGVELMLVPVNQAGIVRALLSGGASASPEKPAWSLEDNQDVAPPA